MIALKRSLRADGLTAHPARDFRDINLVLRM
jgi:hypothetical protein